MGFLFLYKQKVSLVSLRAQEEKGLPQARNLPGRILQSNLSTGLRPLLLESHHPTDTITKDKGIQSFGDQNLHQNNSIAFQCS